jgi:hypothetical protein
MMKYPLGSLRPKLELQPDRNANTLVAMGNGANRLIVGTDTGSQRRMHIYQMRQGNREFINDIGVDTQLDGEFNALAMSHDGYPSPVATVQRPALRGGVRLQCLAGDDPIWVADNYQLTPQPP